MNMKICTKCGVLKLKDEFFFQNKQSGRLHAECKSCYKIHRISYAKEHYIKYGNAYRSRAKTRAAKARSVLQKHMIEYLSDKQCKECGEKDIRTLEFDHLDPAIKSFGISEGIRKGMSWGNILEEISKCRILCANCHKIHTATQFGWYKNI